MIPKKFNLFLNHKISNFKKIIEVDPDKSISIRSFIIASLSQNTSSVKNVLESEDVISTIECLKKLGVRIKKIKPKNYIIYGMGLGSLYAKKNTLLNFGNSGTLARLLIGVLSTTPGLEIKMKGDKSLNKRSMKRLIEAISKFGALFLPGNKFNFPLKLISSEMPIGINYSAGVSAQLKSAVILAGLNSYGQTSIIEKDRSRDHTEKMILQNNHIIKVDDKKEKIIKIIGKRNLKPINISVPNDPSSAAFFSALTLLKENSSLTIKNVGLNKTRTGFYDLLRKHGAKIKFKNLKKINNEPRGDIFIKSCSLKPIKASRSYYTNTTDEYPILFIIASLIKGVSIFKGIGDLTNKESNRITEMQKILKQINIKSKFSKDELKIFGQGKINLSNKNIIVPNRSDHRLCMSSFILGLLTGAKTTINNFETVFTSSPSFLKIMRNNFKVRFEIKK